ncbi:hypothetical protein BN381_10155 [Candidatus Microthrix parvicella RN1]|uniref:Uncharacterized protein n=1 Tax=Candidatus Neomicrothrix parvicella RN1 TaxID=1229780 RepID=R4YVI3_9ACTN|nr:hypothetical protein BN381_10155 [Candidatus Microthrix parvicella RN1]
MQLLGATRRKVHFIHVARVSI